MDIKNKNYYKVYGLNIGSELELPILINSNDFNTDIDITFGKMDEDIYEKINNRTNAQFQKSRMWFHVNGVGTYLIKNGEHIVIDLECDNQENNVKSFLLGSALGMALIQKNILAIHGGTVVIDDKAVILTGDTGAGKSTLTTKFRVSGYGVLADDVSVLESDFEEDTRVNPGYPQQKLCGDTMELLKFDKEKFALVDEDREKYVIPIKSEFIDKSITLDSIYQIEKDNVQDVEIYEVAGIDKINIILNNIYRIEVINHCGLRKEYFNKCLQMAKKIRVFNIKRPILKFTIDRQMNLILSKVNE